MRRVSWHLVHQGLRGLSGRQPLQARPHEGVEAATCSCQHQDPLSHVCLALHTLTVHPADRLVDCSSIGLSARSTQLEGIKRPHQLLFSVVDDHVQQLSPLSSDNQVARGRGSGVWIPSNGLDLVALEFRQWLGLVALKVQVPAVAHSARDDGMKALGLKQHSGNVCATIPPEIDWHGRTFALVPSHDFPSLHCREHSGVRSSNAGDAGRLSRIEPQVLQTLLAGCEDVAVPFGADANIAPRAQHICVRSEVHA
mmetsp:Transcript_71363/g.204747  ORF Transcript_71363/g.204747 Transcript_71363/m.204747 type:complete len:254 (+) Transcript_71363:2514-3275(+)